MVERKIVEQIGKTCLSEFNALSGGSIPYDCLSPIQMGYQEN
jgi:hypothetical protein